MKPLTSALALMAALATPAYAGGLATSPRPIERPANACQHIPWTECGVTRGDGPQAVHTSPGTPVSPAAPVSPPVKELPAPTPCNGGTKGGC